MLVRQQRLDPWLVQHPRQELGGDIARQQTFAVLGEDRHVPDRRVHPQPDKPAEQQIVVQLLHQLTLRAHRIECLQKQCSQQFLRRDRRPADRRIEPFEPARQPFQRRVHDDPDRPQRMIRRDPRRATQIAEQRCCVQIPTAHPISPYLVTQPRFYTISAPDLDLFPHPASAQTQTQELISTDLQARPGHPRRGTNPDGFRGCPAMIFKCFEHILPLGWSRPGRPRLAVEGLAKEKTWVPTTKSVG